MSEDKDIDKLATARKRLQLCIDAESDNRTEALDDLRFVAGDQWDDRTKRAREVDGRPCLTINKLPAFLHQITNDQRQNKPGIKVHPVDDNADVKTAEVIQGVVRHIEYASNADVAYDTAVNSAAACGFGYFRVVTEYCDQLSFDQDIKFKRIANPFTVYFDPSSNEIDGSDARFCFITEELTREEFKAQYPKAEANNDTLLRGQGDTHANWLADDSVRVAEYYFIEEKPAKLVRLNNGDVFWKDELPELLPEDAVVDAERDSKKRIVRWQKITSVDVLEEAEIPCDWIPVFPVYGDELNINGTIKRSGLIRFAKDPQRMYNFWMTAATEEVAMRTKTPYIGAEGQFSGHEGKWNAANNRNFPYLEYKPVTLNGAAMPPPQRQAMADVPVGVLQMAMHANDNIKATTGLFDSSLGAQGNATSGKQEIAQQRQGNMSNFHYIDNLAITIKHAARCILSMIPKIYDTERVVRILGENEEVETTKVNAPAQTPDEMAIAVNGVINNLTVGKYDVTVAVGPSYSTLRQEASASMIEAVRAAPELMQIAGDLVVKAQDWPGAEEFAERIKRTIPPQVLGEEEQPQLPPEAQAAMQQMQQHIQELTGALQEAQSGMDKARLDAKTKIELAHINNEGRQDVEELKGMVQLLLQKMQPPPDLNKEVDKDLKKDDPPSAGFFTSEE